MDFNRILREGVSVLKDNYPLAIPTVVSTFLVSFISLGVIRSPEDQRGLIVMALISLIASFFSHGLTVAMAREAIENGSTSIRSCAYLASRLFAPLFSASVLITAIIGAGFMALFLPGVIAAFIVLFVMPAIVMDRAGPLSSIGISYRLVFSKFKDSALLFIFMLTAGLSLGIANLMLSSIEVVGQLIGVVLSGAFGGFSAVVVLLCYSSLTGRAIEKDEIPKDIWRQ